MILLLLGAAAVSAGMYARTHALGEMIAESEKSNIGIAQGYIDSVWKKHRENLLPLLAGNPALLKDNPQVLDFAQDTVRYFQHMPLVRINIYSGNAMLLLSANGADTLPVADKKELSDVDFITAQIKTGLIASKLQLIGLAGGKQAALVRSFVPIVADGIDPRAPEAALGVVSSVRTQWDAIAQWTLYGAALLGAIWLTLVLLIFVIMSKAEHVISKQYEANLELSAAAAAALAENRDKSQFLANVSHELRTPLNAIIGFSEIIKNEVISNVNNQKYHDYMNDIHGSGVHLLSLINDILDYSKAEAGKLELEVSEVSVTKMIQNCVRLISPRAESGNVQLIEAMPKEALSMLTDGKKFKQILLNLLSNAVKFTPPGGEVHIGAWRDLSNDTYTFEVRDTGIGIAPKDISRAMSPFGQVDNALSRKYEGTGLGLPLTKKFVELMGGKFAIESEVNVGTTITFTLPREIKQRDGIVIKQIA